MEIEGFLLKWTNYISGWKERYFSLSNGVLYYSSMKNSPIKGQIHLKVSKIVASEHDALKIVIDSGTKLLHLRAENISDKIRWLNTLKSSKVEIQENDQNLNKIKNYNITPDLLEQFINKSDFQNKKNEESQNFAYMIAQYLKDIIAQETRLDSSLVNLVNKFNLSRDNEAFKIVENITDIASGLIVLNIIFLNN